MREKKCYQVKERNVPPSEKTVEPREEHAGGGNRLAGRGSQAENPIINDIHVLKKYHSWLICLGKVGIQK
jgi:hypothetical protein